MKSGVLGREHYMDMPSGRKARFIVLEGLDGAGTTTQAALVAEAIRAWEAPVRLTAEPSEGPIGRILRAHVRGQVDLDPRTAALAFVADRADHLTRAIRPALERGEWVVCDRYLLSTLAYQGAEGVDRAWVLAASEGADVPDLTIYLEVPAEVAAQRLVSRERPDRYDALGERLEVSYRESIELLRGCGHRIEIVDGTADPPEVLDRIRAELDFLP